MAELTRWFDLSKGEVPACPGVYLRNVRGTNHEDHSYWDGNQFMFTTAYGVDRAFEMRHRPTIYIGDEWRGLAQDPARKLSRRSDPATSKEAAAKAVRSGMVMTHCRRILACLKKHGPQNANQVGARLKLHPHQVMKRFSDLKNDGFASPNGKVLDGQRVWNAL